MYVYMINYLLLMECIEGTEHWRFPVSSGGAKNALVFDVDAHDIPAKGALPKILVGGRVQKICLSCLRICLTFSESGCETVYSPSDSNSS